MLEVNNLLSKDPNKGYGLRKSDIKFNSSGNWSEKNYIWLKLFLVFTILRSRKKRVVAGHVANIDKLNGENFAIALATITLSIKAIELFILLRFYLFKTFIILVR